MIPPGLLFALGLLSDDGWGQIFSKWPPPEKRMLMNIPESFASSVLPPQEPHSPLFSQEILQELQSDLILSSTEQGQGSNLQPHSSWLDSLTTEPRRELPKTAISNKRTEYFILCAINDLQSLISLYCNFANNTELNTIHIGQQVHPI